jgi:hypothetical protein
MASNNKLKLSDSFSLMNKGELNTLIDEFNDLELVGLPEYGTRAWYVTKCSLWVTGQMLDGNNPLI